jgi:D-alanine-D-alanine ligase
VAENEEKIQLRRYTKDMNTIIVLAGGISNEREVSLRSGQAVAEALESKGYKVIMHDPINGIDNLPPADVVFPALHGEGGEDGTVQAELDRQGLAYVGADKAASGLCYDKRLYKELLRARDFPVANDEIVDSTNFWKSPLISRPFVLKPVDGGSSIDTLIVRDTDALPRETLDKSLASYGEMLLEELIDGPEITVAVLGDEALPVVEIIPPADGEFDYENKYNGATQELCPPKNVNQEMQRQAQALALQVHALTGARDLSRTDMMIAPDDRLVILETNTLPGMTSQSLYPKAAAAAGLDFPELADRLVRMALARKAAI